MGYDGRFTGLITIDPPIPATDLDPDTLLPPDGWSPNGLDDVQLVVVELAPPANTNGGVLFQRGAVAVKAAMSFFSGYHLVEHVQGVVDRWGAGRTFTGCIKCVGPEGDLWAVRVEDGKAERVEPRIVWPDDEEPQR